jgi:hypothetical protein
VRHVDLNVAMPGDGSSWATAFDSVQAAIDDAAAAAPCEVWVAAGMYYIYETGVTDTLTLQGGVDVYGGFDGTETMLDQRDWSANVTVLDGRAGPGSSSRVYHVVTAASDARLDGFVITEGLANGVAPHERGGGIFSDDTDVVVANCSIVDNACAWIGGGIAIIGGAPTIVDSVIADNASAQYAGGLYASGSDTTVSRCVVHGNTSGDDAAGFVLEQGSPVVENSVFYLNNGGDFGGAMDIWQETAALVVNNTFYDNDGPHGGGGVSIRSNLATVSSNVALLNTGTYGPDILPHGGYTPTVADNCYTPVFVDAASRNFRMTSNSPCIDVADDTLAPMTDFDGLDRVDIDDVGNPGTLADAGAFEYQP